MRDQTPPVPNTYEQVTTERTDNAAEPPPAIGGHVIFEQYGVLNRSLRNDQPAPPAPASEERS